MKKYCMVIELKEEFVKDYCELHRNPGPEILDAVKSSGAKELLVWNYKNFSIVYFECENINKYYENMAKIEITQKWNQTVGEWFEGSPKLDGSESIKTCEKIFDLNQKIKGRLYKFRKGDQTLWQS